jgi:hypothetical protein
MQTMKIRIVGISCLVDVNNTTPHKRVILPYDDMSHRERHIPFVEIAEGDVANWSGGLQPTSYQHYNGDVTYLRWELAGHKVTIDTVDLNAPNLWQTTSYEHHVPSLKAVYPALLSYPCDECFMDDPPADLIAGYFDFSKGWLDAGPLDEYFTSFYPTYNWPSGRGTESVELTLPVNDVAVAISINSFPSAGGHDVRIILKPTADTMRMGNLLPEDLINARPYETDTSEHFMLYYNLACPYPENPADLPIPIKSAAPVNACSPVRWI